MCKGISFKAVRARAASPLLLIEQSPTIQMMERDSSTSIVPYFVRSFLMSSRWHVLSIVRDIDRGFPGFEYFEYFPNKTVSKQHVAGFDFYGRDSVLCRHRFEIFDGTFFRDQSSFVAWVHRVFHADGDIGFFSGLNA